MLNLTTVISNLIPTLCLQCNKLQKHDTTANCIANLCSNCEHQLPYLRNCCYRCAMPLPHPVEQGSKTYCGSCLKHHPSYDLIFCAIKYEPPTSNFIINLKHNSDLTSLSTLSELFIKAYRLRQTRHQDDMQADVIIPVPLHWSRQFIRGFNQSHCLASLISKQLKIPIAYNYMERVQRTRPQQGLTKKERLKNLSGCFQTTNNSVEDLTIALFDDVITTGATVEAAAKTLKAAGAKAVIVWSIARTV